MLVFSSGSILLQVDDCNEGLDITNNLTKTVLLCSKHKKAKCLRMFIGSEAHWDLRACYRCYRILPVEEFPGDARYVLSDLGCRLLVSYSGCP